VFLGETGCNTDDIQFYLMVCIPYTFLMRNTLAHEEYIKWFSGDLEKHLPSDFPPSTIYDFLALVSSTTIF